VCRDKKILSTVDKFSTNCGNCQYFAEVVDGYLNGTDAIGMYKYK